MVTIEYARNRLPKPAPPNVIAITNIRPVAIAQTRCSVSVNVAPPAASTAR
jgi:hypothetical protein